MPEVAYSTVVAAPVEQVWQYVEDLHNWCHLMVGFQTLDVIDDRRSMWTLRGDVGILSRQVKVQVDITEWIPLQRVSFIVTGVTERLDGAGAFHLERITGEESPEDSGSRLSSASAAVAAGPVSKPGWLRRLQFAVARSILRRLHRKAARNRATTEKPTAGTGESPDSLPLAGVDPVTVSAPVSSGELSRLAFELRVSPLGPMAPMLDLLMAPMLEPAAQDLADGIREALQA
jgi:carbon monoxide dehydrogenase subunit G